MRAVIDAAGRGVPVLGVCNGFQILCEVGLLPGVLMRNATLNFICRDVHLRVDNADSLFTRAYEHGRGLRLPGRPWRGQLPRRRRDAAAPRTARTASPSAMSTPPATPTPEANANGSVDNIAGILNERAQRPRHDARTPRT